MAALIATLRRAADNPGIGEDAHQLLTVDEDVSPDVIASLADDVERLGVPVVLAIDDFHLTGSGGAEVATWLLDYRPPSLHVVLASRVDPSLRLHRMRASRELVEVRESDLAFSADETKLLLSRFGVELSDPDVAVVQRRSEGWAAGLQMAAISIQHNSDQGGAVHGVELNRHSVSGYFLDEVLYRQPEFVTRFMLESSILDELSATACTAVCGPGAAVLLEGVYRDHLFVSIVDEAIGTYRYHQLIKEVLRAELRARHPGEERDLHERAAEYLAGLGRAGAAARHLLEAGDPAAAFRLLSDGVIVDYGTNPVTASALDDLQINDFAGHPEILVPLAAELLLRGDFDLGSHAFGLGAEAGVDEVANPDLALRFAVVGTMYHHFRGEEAEALPYRERAHRLAARTAGSEDWMISVDATGAYSHLQLGNFDEALRLVDALSSAGVMRTPALEVSCDGIRSQVAWARGELSDAELWANRSLAAADRSGFDRHHSAFLALRTKALLALEARDLSRAAELTEGRLNARRPFLDFMAQVDRARIWEAEGNLDEALASLPAARTVLRSERSVLLAQADELEARIQLALGDPDAALAIADRLPPDRRRVMTVMVYVAANQPDLARKALEALPVPPPNHRSDLELRLLHAEVAIMTNSPHTFRLIREVLAFAELHGFIQTVLDTAPRLAEHLMSAWDRYPPSESLAAIVAGAVESRQQRGTASRPGSLADPLTEAETRVLRRLAQRVSYGDIATDLHLSLNTVKTHLRRIYSKLGVTSRSAAIERAASLGIL